MLIFDGEAYATLVAMMLPTRCCRRADGHVFRRIKIGIVQVVTVVTRHCRWHYVAAASSCRYVPPRDIADITRCR